MSTLVTGAFGCIGAWVLRGLLAAGERPVAFDLGDDPWRVRMIAGPDAIDRVVLVRATSPTARRSGASCAITESAASSTSPRGRSRCADRIRRRAPSSTWSGPRTSSTSRAAAGQAAVLGRKFQIRWGGSTDLIYTADVARALLAAAASRLDGARVYKLHGSSAAIADVVRLTWPAAEGTITHVEQPIPFPAALDDARHQADLGPAPPTALDAGIRQTLDEFARLQKDGRLDSRELT